MPPFRYQTWKFITQVIYARRVGGEWDVTHNHCPCWAGDIANGVEEIVKEIVNSLGGSCVCEAYPLIIVRPPLILMEIPPCP